MSDAIPATGYGYTGSTGSAAAQGSKDALGQEDFLKLMIAQFRNQDPFKPMENGDFLGQMAQFGTVSGIQELQQAFAGLSGSLVADQTLQASSLLGREVLVPVQQVTFQGEPLVGAVELPAGVHDAAVEIKDANGELVARVPVSGEGLVEFSWDGRTLEGEAAAPGDYAIEASYRSGDQAYESGVLMAGTVDSVLVGGSHGATIELDTLGMVRVADVYRIQ